MSHRKFLTAGEKELDHSLDRLFAACNLIYQNPSVEHFQNIIAVLEELHTKHPDFRKNDVMNRLAATYLQFGAHLENKGRMDDALENYRKAAKLRPGEEYAEESMQRCKDKLFALGLRIFTDEKPEHLKKLEASKPEVVKREPRAPEGEVVSFNMASSIWDRPGQPKRPRINPFKEFPPPKKGFGK